MIVYWSMEEEKEIASRELCDNVEFPIIPHSGHPYTFGGFFEAL